MDVNGEDMPANAMDNATLEKHWSLSHRGAVRRPKIMAIQESVLEASRPSVAMLETGKG